MEYKKDLIGGSIAFLLATSCCWLPWLLVAIGGATGLAWLTKGLEKFSWLFGLIALGFFGFALFKFYLEKYPTWNNKVIIKSTITCPECQYKKEEEMPTSACQYFYECENCKTILKPINNDCCVFCSYATVQCPPMQLNEDCC